ncbi:MAG: 50S ribosomal protein L18 [Candidatus Lambdaproteobacteria bacterium RIFOXYD12_FULL_49_8]|uniref:Large ribosomal subunit protein uL18 n=1 Tax=Candidatus Lambdaproteobacteria bacterium RIFOXYD2_FULL_50_16 TaxID=1817772 RepID=A0A1F6G6E6_9PROT|nr:MAG: 50S ribosomal protein L18 [Candidatus Lambdaproteobacteria bacterium RIFOXYD2_FULL_50_16]OGG96404.1 MAG: 50S ribosomal protein L18 [Candidatus Lambdaproteobacteria bacterium RIFOXYD12_FULL_49_8]
MESSKKRILTRGRKKAHIRKNMTGTAQKPRISVFRSAKHIYVQAIDDDQGQTLAHCSTLNGEVKKGIEGATGNKDAAESVGKAFGLMLKEKGIENVVFDRNGYIYHGRVKSLADGIREAGIQF